MFFPPRWIETSEIMIPYNIFLNSLLSLWGVQILTFPQAQALESKHLDSDTDAIPSNCSS